MGRLKFTDVPMPPKPFRLDGKKATARFSLKFETEEKSAKEDLKRATRLREAKGLLSRKTAKRAKRLRKRLLKREVQNSLASSRFMRDLRLRVCGQLWRLIESNQITSSRFFTIIPRHWEIEVGCLDEFCPRKALDRLRRQLIAYGANTAKGFFYAAIHGEFDATDLKYRLHLHGIASDEMLEVIRRLRKASNFRSKSGDHANEKVRQRVRVERREIDNLPKTITYTLKSFWPSRQSDVKEDKPMISAARRKRIEEPQHTEYLLWLESHAPHDLILTVGLSASRHGIKISKRRVQ